MPSESFDRLIALLRNQPSTNGFTVDQLRAYIEDAAAAFPLAKDVAVETLTIDRMAAEWIKTPVSRDNRVILYLHGGGYISGSIHSHREMVSRICRAAEARALLIDYRLAPEHPFPAALEDVISAHEWLLQNRFSPDKLIIAGDSAGGGLTIAALLRIRDMKRPQPAAAVCISPWIDLECRGPSMVEKAAEDPMVQREDLLKMAELYLGGVESYHGPLEDRFDRLPPLLVQVGSAETLLDDAVRLSAAAERDGVDVILEKWGAMVHVWHYFAQILPEGQEAVDRMGLFIRQHTL